MKFSFLLLTMAALLPCRSEATGNNQCTPSQDWAFHSYDKSNTNYNPCEQKLTSNTVAGLKVAFDRFNTGVEGEGPAGFVFESVLGLKFRNSVMGVVASPLVVGGNLYYVDMLGTLHKCNSKSGVCSGGDYWTVKLADPNPGFDITTAGLPELFYTSPIIKDDKIYIIGSVYGRLHVVDIGTGLEFDFDKTTPGTTDPLVIPSGGLTFSSTLGDSTIVDVDERVLYIVNFNIIIDDAAGLNGNEGGMQVAIDITNLDNTTVVWKRKSIDNNTCPLGKPFGAGASVGAGLAVDEERGYIFGGTGQFSKEPYDGYPSNAIARKKAVACGFVDRSDSIYAIDIRTGQFVWSNQFHKGDVFELNCPVVAGPGRTDGPRDADVLSPPVMWTAGGIDMIGVGSKGGLYRAVNRENGKFVWEQQISKPTGLGGIQAGSAYANGFVYVVGFEGIDDKFSDLQFDNVNRTSQNCNQIFSKYRNAFFSTFSPFFWADVEDTGKDGDPSTGMQLVVWKLRAQDGNMIWKKVLKEGAAMRHLSVVSDILFVTTTSGKLIILSTEDGTKLYEYQTLDLNDKFNMSIGKPFHAGMNAGAVISDGIVYLGYGNQNEPSGGITALKLDDY